MPLQVVTANRLSDGRVVWLTPSGDWSLAVDAAALLADKAEIETGLAAGQRAFEAQHVVEPYAIDVEAADGRVVPKALRERIRAYGPTVPLVGASPARPDAA